jgi:misacylated tRNA(Ala) deacylase
VTDELFREDAYLAQCAARVVAVDGAGVILDRTVFYPAGGGQPGDRGELRLPDGSTLAVGDTRKAEAGVLHVVAGALPAPGRAVTAVLDWPRRLRLMRMHSCLHLLCRAVGGAVTGGQVGEDKGRLDFDLPEGAPDKAVIEDRINAWIREDRPIRALWIGDEELAARPELVRTLSVQPPRGQGRVRLVEIDGIDLQACGGTHVRSTSEIGPVEIGRIESKGRHNRRVTVRLVDPDGA